MLKRVFQVILLSLFSVSSFAECELSTTDLNVFKIYHFSDKSGIESLRRFNLQKSDQLKVGIPKNAKFYSENLGTDEHPILMNMYESDAYELYFVDQKVNMLPTRNLIKNNYFDILVSAIYDFRINNNLTCEPEKIANFLGLTSLIVHSGSKYIEVFASKTESVIVWYHDGDRKHAGFIIKTKYNDRILVGGVLEKS
ncbi:hypothetical protein BGP78_10285 [Pseudoalteromonas sp. MSK9-3]|uniref:hypothetical protein n=1 Tax=Pseudoalteromonas sp. MSK9-3 TaxID=1897633 RepID=UPI000E6B879F|nr:hypothetical protein [Pseudoalteromonas sp. MSK9-3]RJE77079.1 hypothetical protein BGP78_10285 [Pseudoalteromonas sp. MSK9-3]